MAKMYQLQAAVRILAHIPGEIVVPIHQGNFAQDAPNDSQSLGVRVATR